MAWKEFDYSCLSTRTNLEYRPYVRVIVRVQKELSLYAIIDSGCQTTMINSEVAPLLGVSLASCKKVLVGGVGKGEQKGYQTTLEIEVPDCKTSFISPVIFANLPADMLLGQDAFFEHFHILFEGNVKKFKLNRITRIKNVQ